MLSELIFFMVLIVVSVFVCRTTVCAYHLVAGFEDVVFITGNELIKRTNFKNPLKSPP